MKKQNNYLFVYGTLRRGEYNDFREFLEIHAKFVDRGMFTGKLYLINDYPGVVPSSNSSDIVYGEVYKMKSAELVLAELDRYEECSSEFPYPTEYIRNLFDVELESGKKIKSWIYIYNWDLKEENLIPSGDFLENSIKD